jgi:hypothetical protein
MTPLIFPIAVLTAVGLKFVPGNAAYSIFYKNGFHLLRKHYYLPIPEEDDLSNAFWERRSELVGLEMNDEFALGLLHNVFPLYLDEFRESFPTHKSSSDPAQFYLINGNFMAIDAHVYYAFIRHFKPKQIVEIGAGNSTLLAAAACRRNLKDNSEGPKLIAIEPFPNAMLKEGLQGLSQLIEDKVQDVDFDLFASLQSGDILFIDSTHVLRSGGDVQLEYCEILPRLAPGVLVHMHDISLPKPYPRVYFENQLYWNEQYLLQAFLCFNSKFEVIWPGNYMMLKWPEKVCAVFAEYHEMRKFYPMSEPSSFWMRVRSGEYPNHAPSHRECPGCGEKGNT